MLDTKTKSKQLIVSYQLKLIKKQIYFNNKKDLNLSISSK